MPPGNVIIVPMDADFARDLVDRWAEAWNDHDLEAILDHFAADVVFSSPVAAQLMPGSGGTVRGKAALREYWAEGLRRIPDLRFEVLGCYLGVDTIVINYRNQAGRLVNEVLFIGADGLITQGHGTYLSEGGEAAGVRA